MITDKVRDEKTQNNEDRQNVKKVTEILYEEKATQTDDHPVQTTKETTVKDKKKKKGKEDENNGDKQNLKLLDEPNATHSDDPPKTTTNSEETGKKKKKKNKDKEKNDNANNLEKVTQLLAESKISLSKNPSKTTTTTFETIGKNKKKKNTKHEIDDIIFVELTEDEAKATVSFGGPPKTLTPEQIERRKEKVRKFNQYPLNFEGFVELLELAKTNVYRPTLSKRTTATTSKTVVVNKNYNKDEEKKTTFDRGTERAKDKVGETSALPASDLPPEFISRVQRSLTIEEELNLAVEQVVKNTTEIEDMVNKMINENKKKDNKIN